MTAIMKRIIFGICVMLAALTVMAQDRFCIAKDGKATTIVVDENDWKGVLRAANNLGDDVKRVTGTASAVIDNEQLTIDNDVWFDLQGKRIEKPTKDGLYIKNGRKVIVNTK
jgi:hypothetical protein